MTRMTQAFLSKGFAACLVSFRGCNGEDNNSPGAYHLGFTRDLHLVIDKMSVRYPDVKLFLGGFSLGGNVILKCLGKKRYVDRYIDRYACRETLYVILDIDR